MPALCFFCKTTGIAPAIAADMVEIDSQHTCNGADVMELHLKKRKWRDLHADNE
jgi:hypothetical protein